MMKGYLNLGQVGGRILFSGYQIIGEMPDAVEKWVLKKWSFEDVDRHS